MPTPITVEDWCRKAEFILRQPHNPELRGMQTYRDVIFSLSRQFPDDYEFDWYDCILLMHIVFAWIASLVEVGQKSPSFYPDKRHRLNIANITNSIRRGGDVSQRHIVQMTAVIDNSVVAVSKYLHCLAPNRFPIWDQRVARAITRVRAQAGDRFRTGNPDHYIVYRDTIRAWAPNPMVLERLNALDEYPLFADLPALRKIEAVLYYHDMYNNQHD